MPEETKTNSALRLHAFFSDYQSKANQNVRTSQVLAEIFGVDEEDHTEIRRRLHLIDDLFIRVPEELRAAEIYTHEFVRDFAQARRTLASLRLQGQSLELLKQLPKEVVASLRLAGGVLRERRSEYVADEEAVAEVARRLGELFKYVETESLNPRFSELTLQIIASLRQAIDQYRIAGIAAFEEALERSLGNVILFHQQGNTMPEEGRARVWRVLGSVLFLVSKALTWGSFTLESAQEFLELE